MALVAGLKEVSKEEWRRKDGLCGWGMNGSWGGGWRVDGDSSQDVCKKGDSHGKRVFIISS